MFDVVVVGGGIMGASAARHLARRGVRIAIVAAPEPADPSGHFGPFAAHYDVSRLTSLIHVDPIEAELARRAAATVGEIDALAPEPVFSQSGHLTVVLQEADRRLAVAAAAGLELMDQAGLAGRFPDLEFPSMATGYLEPPPSGHFNPRAMIAAMLGAAVNAGALLIGGTASALKIGRRVEVQIADHPTIGADRVLVAAGAYCNQPGLLPRRLAMRLKTESVLLAEVDPAVADGPTESATLVYDVEDPGIEDVYSVAPIRYPDGRAFAKWGANTVADRWLELGQVGNWYREGDAAPSLVLLQPSFQAVHGDLVVLRSNPHRCVVTYTAHGRPYIDEVVADRVYVAVGGNGRAAKWSDPLGRLAADLVATGDWTDPLPRHEFAVVYEGEQGWTGAELLSDRLAM